MLGSKRGTSSLQQVVADAAAALALDSVRHGYEKPAGYTDTDTTDTDTDDHFCIRGQIRIHIHDIRTRRGGYLLPI